MMRCSSDTGKAQNRNPASYCKKVKRVNSLPAFGGRLPAGSAGAEAYRRHRTAARGSVGSHDFKQLVTKPL